MFRSSLKRLAIAYGAVFALSAALLLGAVYYRAADMLDRQLRETVEEELQSLGARFDGLGTEAFIDLVRRRAEEDYVHGAVYLLTDGTGRFLAGNIAAQPPAAAVVGGWTEFDMAMPGADERAHRILARVVELPNGLTLLVGHDVQERFAFRALILDTIAWAGLASLALAALGGWWLSRRISRNAQAIAEHAHRVLAGEQPGQLPLSGSGDEVDRLIQEFNLLLRRVEELTLGMRAVMDSTAHDLRSNLNRIRGAAQLALTRRSDGERVAALEQVVAEVDGLQHTLDELLRIAFAQSGQARLEPLDLSRLVEELGELYEPIVTARGLEFSLRVEPGLQLLGHRQLLAQALSNLLDNAVKYTPAGTIRLAACRDGGLEVVEVADTGPGIPASQRAEAIKRFTRLPGSSTVEGIGLGLSLVNAVAQLHGGELALGDNGPGVRAQLRLPPPGRPQVEEPRDSESRRAGRDDAGRSSASLARSSASR